MSFLFPYWMVKEHSREGIYGFGDVGRNFFLQLKLMNYADCVLVTDREFEDFKECNLPFVAPDRLGNIELDYLIIAVLDKKVADDIKASVITKYGENIVEEKIVWSPYYNANIACWPYDKSLYLKNPAFYEYIADKYFSVQDANWKFDRGRFYQSYLDIGISGIRNSQERIEIYHLRNILKKTDSVLDVGCNCGFFDLQVAPLVRKMTGMDIEPNFIDIANKTALYGKIENASFICASYADAEVKDKYDAVFSLAVHSNIILSGLSEEEYVRKILANVADEGHFFFESHDWKNDAERYRRLSGKFIEHGFELVMRKDYRSDFERRITVFRKKRKM